MLSICIALLIYCNISICCYDNMCHIWVRISKPHTHHMSPTLLCLETPKKPERVRPFYMWIVRALKKFWRMCRESLKPCKNRATFIKSLALMSFFAISIKLLHLEKGKNTRYEELTKFFVKYFITLTFTDEAFILTRPFKFYFYYQNACSTKSKTY